MRVLPVLVAMAVVPGITLSTTTATAVPTAASSVSTVTTKTFTAAVNTETKPTSPYGTYKKTCSGTKVVLADMTFRYHGVRKGSATMKACQKTYGRTTIVKAYKVTSMTNAVWGGWFSGHSVVIQDASGDGGEISTGQFLDGWWFFPDTTIRCPGATCQLAGMGEFGITNQLLGEPTFLVRG